MKVADHREDLCLNRHIQSRRGLVGDQKSGVTDQGDGDNHALSHTAGKLIGVLHLSRFWDSHEFQRLLNFFLDLVLAQIFLIVKEKRLADLFSHGQHRV